MSKLPADCLNEIFEFLDYDKATLHSCLFVNRLWCEVAVRILWRNTWNYKTTNIITLIACLPNESKEILRNNGIIISTPTSKPPMFNYAAFCKILSTTSNVDYMISKCLLKNQQSTSAQIIIVKQEIYKLFMRQISSLKQLYVYHNSLDTHTPLTIYPGARDCLKNLSLLDCSSDINVEFSYQLSQICHNLLSLNISFYTNVISNGLTDLLSVQKHLKYLYLYAYADVTELISLTKLPNTLTKLFLYGVHYLTPLSFITRFTNLQELELSFDCDISEEFNKLQYVTFSQLKILKIRRTCPRFELLINFLEINGENLRECYIGDDPLYLRSDNSLNLSIAKFCPNLRNLSVGFKNDELETLKIVFSSCQYLESISIWCGGVFLSEKTALEIVAKLSPKNFYELKLVYRDYLKLELQPEELESFFVSWENRIPKKSLSLIVSGRLKKLDRIAKNMEVINKYIKLDVIRKFRRI